MAVFDSSSAGGGSLAPSSWTLPRAAQTAMPLASPPASSAAAPSWGAPQPAPSAAAPSCGAPQPAHVAELPLGEAVLEWRRPKRPGQVVRHYITSRHGLVERVDHATGRMQVRFPDTLAVETRWQVAGVAEHNPRGPKGMIITRWPQRAQLSMQMLLSFAIIAGRFFLSGALIGPRRRCIEQLRT